MTTHKSPRSKVPRNANDPEQSERFIETARKHETDETGKEFERLFKKAVPAKTSTRKSHSQKDRL